MDHDEYELECEIIRNENKTFLQIFKSELANKALSTKTINSHVENARFFIDEYLLREMPYPMRDGWLCIDDFFGFFYQKMYVVNTRDD